MERGFPNKQPCKGDAPKLNQPSVTSSPATSEGKKMVPIPTGPIEEVVTTDDPHWPSEAGRVSVAIAHMPPVNPSRLHEPHSSCLILIGVKEKILALPGFPGPMLTKPYPDPYHLSPVLGGGIGMFAVRHLRRGEWTAVDRPLLVLPRGLPLSEKNPTFPFELLKRAVREHMGVNSRAAFMALHNCKSADKSDILGIVNTNAVDIGPLPGHNVTYAAVLRDLSRINHSCAPNARLSWYLTTFSMHLRATEPIPAGSPITISYIDICLPRSKRQEMLRRMYDFTCTCRSCSLTPSASIESDRKRAFLAAICCMDVNDESDLKAWIKDPLLPDSHIIDRWLAIFDIADSESVWDDRIWTAAAQRLCKAYCALGNREAAVEWAVVGLSFSYCWKGNDGGWKDVVTAPEKTAWWNLRKVLTTK